MWKIILLLWSIPLALGLVMLLRVVGGAPAISDKESRLLFGNAKEMTLSLWIGFKFAVLSALLFILGVVEGLILINIGSVWLVLVPPVTGLGAMLFLVQWLRSGSVGEAIQPSPRNSSVFDFHAR